MNNTKNKNYTKIALALPVAAALAAAIVYRKPLLRTANTLIDKTGGLSKTIIPTAAALGTKIVGTKAGGGMLSSMLVRGPVAMIAGGLVTYALSKLRRNPAKA